MAQPGQDYTAEVGTARWAVRLADALPITDITKHTLRTQPQRLPLAIPTADLVATAQWMDAEIDRLGMQEGHWATRVGRLRIKTYQMAVQQFVEDNHLTLDGATHIVGMLGAGKSTLMDVLAVWAAQHGYRITLILSDVSDVLRRCDFFFRLGLSVAPMLGKSSRNQHLTRLHGMEGADWLAQPTQPLHRGFHWLSTACPLTALTEGVTFTDHKRPCNSLVRGGETYTCPLYGGCAYHNAQRDLVEARIWVGTSASMLRTKADWQLTGSSTQFAELIYKNSDIVVVDEADRVQVQFDQAFSPGQTLANNRYGGWLDALVSQVRSVQAEAGRGIRSDSLIATFRRVLESANVACEKLYDLLLAEQTLHNWISARSYLTGWTLFDYLASQLIDNRAEVHPDLPKLFEDFLENRDPLGEERPHPLNEYVRSLMATDRNAGRIRQQLAEWLQQEPLFDKVLTNATRHELVLTLEFTLLLSVLENRLNYLVNNWKHVESTFKLLDWGETLFPELPREYLSLVPMAPAGNVLAFRYEGGNDGEPGRLSFFKNLGLGRSFLLNFHKLYEVDNVPGPHVLLLSGTSWAGTSPSYHLAVPVDALLCSTDDELAGIRASTFSFWPVLNSVNKPIKVSGLMQEQQRYDALKGIVNALAKVDKASQRSQLEVNWGTLLPNRQRALFVVGSYREARVVRDQLRKVRPEWAEQIIALVPDSDTFIDDRTEAEQSLQRGKVHEFARRNGKVLIAPLMAIERGHNILNDLNEAAIGTAYFLVRPHPHPDDLSLSVKAINAWALARCDRPAWYRQQIGHWPADAAAVHKSFKRGAVRRWHILMQTPMRFRTLPDDDRQALHWDQLVSIWQVIGRLIRGGVRANVYFCDAAFAEQSVLGEPDTARTSLLVGMRDLLAPYFDPTSSVPARDRAIAEALYQPFFQALTTIQGLHHEPNDQLTTPDGL